MSKFVFMFGFVLLTTIAFVFPPLSKQLATLAGAGQDGSKATAQTKEKGEENDEVEIKLADAPAAVRAAIQKLAPETSVKKVTREGGKDATVFEVDYVVDGVKCSADLSQDGTIMELEKGVKLTDLPATAAAALQKHFQGAEIKSINSVQAFYYEVSVKQDGKSRAAKVFASGAVEEGEND